MTNSSEVSPFKHTVAVCSIAFLATNAETVVSGDEMGLERKRECPFHH